MYATLLTPPALEPVSLAEAKAHLRLETGDDDTLVSTLVTAARIQVEAATRRVLVSQTWRLTLQAWPDGPVVLPFAPASAVTRVAVYDAADVAAVQPASAYRLELDDPPRLVLIGPVARPGRRVNGIEIDVTAGYGSSGLAVPQPLRQAIMLLVARWYENRDGIAVGSVPGAIADAYEALVAPFRRLRLV
jgi:uncharacterized phiE125 gp8 family phage protein